MKRTVLLLAVAALMTTLLAGSAQAYYGYCWAYDYYGWYYC